MDQRSVRDILAGKTYFIRTFGCNNCIVPSGLGKGTIPLWQDRRSQ